MICHNLQGYGQELHGMGFNCGWLLYKPQLVLLSEDDIVSISSVKDDLE